VTDPVFPETAEDILQMYGPDYTHNHMIAWI